MKCLSSKPRKLHITPRDSHWNSLMNVRVEWRTLPDLVACVASSPHYAYAEDGTQWSSMGIIGSLPGGEDGKCSIHLLYLWKSFLRMTMTVRWMKLLIPLYWHHRIYHLSVNANMFWLLSYPRGGNRSAAYRVSVGFSGMFWAPDVFLSPQMRDRLFRLPFQARYYRPPFVINLHFF